MTMRTTLRTLLTASGLVVALSVGMVGCSTFLPAKTDQTVRDSAEISLRTIKAAWIPALNLYASQKPCGENAPPCRDRVLYAKLYYATDAVTLCMQFVVREELTMQAYSECKGKFDAARQMFLEGGLKLKETAQ